LPKIKLTQRTSQIKCDMPVINCTCAARRLLVADHNLFSTPATFFHNSLPYCTSAHKQQVLQRKARFIKDCASYMQNCPSPARDVFTHASQAVSSLVVVPLIMGEESLGALYFTQETPCDFSNIQDALLVCRISSRDWATRHCGPGLGFTPN
jgi:hypothetical protein